MTDQSTPELDERGCNCQACSDDPKHMSDCALHGRDVGRPGAAEISYEGPCDCDARYIYHNLK